MLERDLLRAARFEHPEKIPCRIDVSPSCWDAYPRSELIELMVGHPEIFPDAHPDKLRDFAPDVPPRMRAGGDYVDSWGSVWRTSQNGIVGAVVRHPLEDWNVLDSFSPPDPENQDGWDAIDWREIRAGFQTARAAGKIACGGLRHGHTYMTLTYLRGYENVVFDMADEDPRLDRLIAMIEDFNMGLVERFVAAGAEWVGYPEDLGMQVGPMLTPDQFRRYILPSYVRLMKPARTAGAVVHMHCDGDIRQLADGLLETGLDVLNIQDLVNGIDWIRENLKGRVAIDLDVDRQKVTRFGTPAEIDALIRTEIAALGAPEGGLMLIYGLYPGVPIGNAHAVASAMEKYSTMYS